MKKSEKRDMLYVVLRAGDACQPALDWVEGKTIEEAIAGCGHIRWMLWALVHLSHNGYRHLTWDCVDMKVYYKILRIITAPLIDPTNPAMRRIRKAARTGTITDREVNVIDELVSTRDCGEAANVMRLLPYTLNYPGTLFKELEEYIENNQTDRERVLALLKKLVPIKIWKKTLKDLYVVTPKRRHE